MEWTGEDSSCPACYASRPGGETYVLVVMTSCRERQRLLCERHGLGTCQAVPVPEQDAHTPRSTVKREPMRIATLIPPLAMPVTG